MPFFRTIAFAPKKFQLFLGMFYFPYLFLMSKLRSNWNQNSIRLSVGYWQVKHPIVPFLLELQINFNNCYNLNQILSLACYGKFLFSSHSRCNNTDYKYLDKVKKHKRKEYHTYRKSILK
jgi:hypothetical protein